MVASGMAAAAVVGAGVNMYTGSKNAKAAKDAAEIQAASGDKAIAEQQRQYDLTRSDQMPFLQTGTQASQRLGQLMGLGGNTTSGDISTQGTANIMPYGGMNSADYGSLAKPFTMADYQADPGYAFRLSEGQKALDRTSAAGGKYFSGGAIKGLTDYNQNSASQEFGNAYNRYNTNQTNLYNRLAGLSGAGQTSANQLATTGQNTANQIGGTMIGQGNALGAGQIASTKAWTTGLNSAANSLSQAAGSYMGGSM